MDSGLFIRSEVPRFDQHDLRKKRRKRGVRSLTFFFGGPSGTRGSGKESRDLCGYGLPRKKGSGGRFLYSRWLKIVQARLYSIIRSDSYIQLSL